MGLLPVFRNFFHAGYVVRDVDKFTANMASKFGISKWQVLRLPDESPASALGFAYVGETMIELVEVDLKHELMSIHRGWVPESDTDAKLNHLAYLVDSEDEVRSLIGKLEGDGVPTALVSSFGDIFNCYYYADTVSALGHFCEFVSLGPDGRAFLAEVPRN